MTFAATTRLLNAFGQGFAQVESKFPAAPCLIFIGTEGGERSLALGKGYTTILTDTGHIGDGVSASWTRLADGKPDMVKRVDFFYRAAHDVTVAGKAFAETYYAAKVEHAYFDGCSTGGRMAMIEADRYPEDHQGVIAGDPLLSNITSAARAVVQKAAVSSPAAYTPKPRLQRSTRG